MARNKSLRSEERFSRNAETDLVCRLLLEKKTVPEVDHFLQRADTDPVHKLTTPFLRPLLPFGNFSIDENIKWQLPPHDFLSSDVDRRSFEVHLGKRSFFCRFSLLSRLGLKLSIQA